MAIVIVPQAFEATLEGCTSNPKHVDGLRANVRSVQHIANLEAFIVSVLLLATCALHLLWPVLVVASTVTVAIQ